MRKFATTVTRSEGTRARRAQVERIESLSLRMVRLSVATLAVYVCLPRSETDHVPGSGDQVVNPVFLTL